MLDGFGEVEVNGMAAEWQAINATQDGDNWWLSALFPCCTSRVNAPYRYSLRYSPVKTEPNEPKPQDTMQPPKQ